MALSRPKIASLVASQVPEFVREDYPTFIAFLEAYYEYLEDEIGVELHTIRDIDTTLESFLQHFRNEVATNIPYNVVNERFLLTHIKDQYLAKGSEASFKLLFRLLFNKDITIDYPSRQMLRASDGKWNQDVSIFAKVNAGTADMIVGKMVDVVTATRTLRVLVDRRQNVEIEVDRVVQIAEGIYEFYVDRRFFGNINVNDRLRYNNEFDATVLATTAKITIQQGGRNFKAGQLYSIKNGNGTGSVLKVKSVDSVGSIISAEFIKYGVGYETDFTSSFMAETGQVTTGIGATAFNIGPSYVGIYESTSGFTEQGIINNTDYNIDSPGVSLAWDGTYSGEVIREFYNDNKEDIINPEDPAIIKVSLGALAKYPGYFQNNDGFLDDAIYIQDSKYYQAFSYVIKIDERLDDYRSAVKTLIHPSGMALFGEYDIRNEFDLGVTLESMVKVLALAAQDAFSMQDSKTLAFGKGLTDSFATTDAMTRLFTKSITATTLNYNGVVDNETVTMSDTTGTNSTRTVPFFGISKALSDTQGLTDSTTVGFSKALSDAQAFSDAISKFDITKLITDVADSVTPTDVYSSLFTKSVTGTDTATATDAVSTILTTKGLTDSQSLTDSTTNTFTKVVNAAVVGYNDLVTFAESTVFTFNKYLVDTVTLTDSTSFSLNNTSLPADTFSTSDSGTILINPYAESYFLTDYVGATITF